MGSERDLSPSEALERWLDKQRAEKSEASIQSYYYRLKLFVEWAEEQGIKDMAAVDGWTVDEYELHRRSKEVAASTLHNEIKTLRRWLMYLAQIGVVDRDVAEGIEIPQIPDSEQSDDTRLSPDDARELINYYRDSSQRANRGHALLEFAWHTGARVGGIRAVDLRDLEIGEAFVRFVHRPEQGTPLKNGRDGERVVALPQPVVKVLEEFIDSERMDSHDDHGRSPLFTSSRGRPTTGTLRDWMYRVTQPCVYGPCPHDRERQSCEYREKAKLSGCPSSRSPHQVRTGSITWMLNRGDPADVVSKRVNATVEVIEQHYDKEQEIEEMEQRRREYVGDIREQ
jgi:site-specific recombinase XerD